MRAEFRTVMIHARRRAPRRRCRVFALLVVLPGQQRLRATPARRSILDLHIVIRLHRPLVKHFQQFVRAHGHMHCMFQRMVSIVSIHTGDATDVFANLPTTARRQQHHRRIAVRGHAPFAGIGGTRAWSVGRRKIPLRILGRRRLGLDVRIPRRLLVDRPAKLQTGCHGHCRHRRRSRRPPILRRHGRMIRRRRQLDIPPMFHHIGQTGLDDRRREVDQRLEGGGVISTSQRGPRRDLPPRLVPDFELSFRGEGGGGDGGQTVLAWAAVAEVGGEGVGNGHFAVVEIGVADVGVVGVGGQRSGGGLDDGRLEGPGGDYPGVGRRGSDGGRCRRRWRRRSVVGHGGPDDGGGCFGRRTDHDVLN
mmetsp:Transcript_286/g.569  ORF Transcript_286/g.569 Transcript_286/m.569 type:complete len:363 (-) Transcript_286:1061-2149(-)